jgi:hypothetical protein
MAYFLRYDSSAFHHSLSNLTSMPFFGMHGIALRADFLPTAHWENISSHWGLMCFLLGFFIFNFNGGENA